MFKYEYSDGKIYNSDDKYKKIFTAYFDIDTYKDLKRNKLRKIDFDIIPIMLHEMAQEGVAYTFAASVAQWFQKKGCMIEWADEHKINYSIKMKRG